MGSWPNSRTYPRQLSHEKRDENILRVRETFYSACLKFGAERYFLFVVPSLTVFHTQPFREPRSEQWHPPTWTKTAVEPTQSWVSHSYRKLRTQREKRRPSLQLSILSILLEVRGLTPQVPQGIAWKKGQPLINHCPISVILKLTFIPLRGGFFIRQGIADSLLNPSFFTQKIQRLLTISLSILDRIRILAKL